MKILILGDIVGEPGRRIVEQTVPILRRQWSIDFVVANAENAASGSGINPRCFNQIMAAGVDACTMGDHAYRKTEIYSLFEAKKPICRPANFPKTAPGPQYLLLEHPGVGKIAVICLLGRMFMKPVDCPFEAVDRILVELAGEAKIILVDMHAEATSEKQLMAHHLKGRVTAVVGTHTHVPTADARVFPPGTAYITDLGMTGPYDSIIGRDADRVLEATITFKPIIFDVAKQDPRISGVLIDVDPATGLASRIELVHLDRQAIAALTPASVTSP